MLAVLARPNDQEWLLLFHLVGVFLLFGGILAVTTASLAALARGAGGHTLALRRVALVGNLVVVLPGFVLAYVFGAMLADRRYPNEPDWLDLAFPLTDISVVFGFVV